MPSTRPALSIAQEVAASVGLEQPATLSDAANPHATTLLSLLNRGCQILAAKRGPFGESWPELTREHTFLTVDGQDAYALPQGFVEVITDTVWDRHTYREAPGPLTPQEWQRLKGGLIDTVALTPRYRLHYDPAAGVTRFRLDPVPSDEAGGAGEEIAFEYLSRFWVRSGPTSPIDGDRISSDSDIPLFPAHLVGLDLEWRTRKSQGLDYRTDIAEFELERDRVFTQTVGLRNVNMSPQPESYLRANVPESGFGGV